MSHGPVASATKRGFVPPKSLIYAAFLLVGVIVGVIPSLLIQIYSLRDFPRDIDFCRFEQIIRAQGDTRVADNYIIPCFQYRLITNPVLGNPFALLLIVGLCALAYWGLTRLYRYYHGRIRSGIIVGRRVRTTRSGQSYELIVMGDTRAGKLEDATWVVDQEEYQRLADGVFIIMK